jgi:hypothetical protein
MKHFVTTTTGFITAQYFPLIQAIMIIESSTKFWRQIFVPVFPEIAQLFLHGVAVFARFCEFRKFLFFHKRKRWKFASIQFFFFVAEYAITLVGVGRSRISFTARNKI